MRIPRLIRIDLLPFTLFALAMCLSLSVAGARVVVSYPLSDASGHVQDKGSDKPINATNDLADPKDYAQAGPAAGSYGEITLSDADAAAIKSAHFGGQTKLDLGPAADSPLNLTGDFTVTAWAKFDAIEGYHMLLATGAGSGNGWKFGINEGNLAFTANGVADVIVEDHPIEAGKWLFLAVTVAGDKDARTINFYVNGKKVNTDDMTADDIKASDAAQMHIGGAENADSVDESFVGNLARLQVFDGVLDPAAIKVAARGPKLVVSYPMSDASGHVQDKGSDKPINATNDLGDPKDYAQAGPAAGSYGEITLSDADAAAIKSAHFGGQTKLDLGPAADSPLNLTGNFTVTAWAKFDATDGYHMLLATGAGSGNGWKFGINGGNLAFTANGVADVIVEDQPIEAGKWVFLAVTVAGNKDARTINFYVNGKQVNTSDMTADDIKVSDTAQMHIAGAENADSVDESFVGNLARLEVFDAVLDAAAIKAAARVQTAAKH